MNFPGILDMTIRGMPSSPGVDQPSAAPPASRPWDILNGFQDMPQPRPPAPLPPSIGPSLIGPTNGASTGPHVHVLQFDPSGKIIDPGSNSPITNGRMTTPFGGRDAMTGKPGHNGVDWAKPR